MVLGLTPLVTRISAFFRGKYFVEDNIRRLFLYMWCRYHFAQRYGIIWGVLGFVLAAVGAAGRVCYLVVVYTMKKRMALMPYVSSVYGVLFMTIVCIALYECLIPCPFLGAYAS